MYELYDFIDDEIESKTEQLQKIKNRIEFNEKIGKTNFNNLKYKVILLEKQINLLNNIYESDLIPTKYINALDYKELLNWDKFNNTNEEKLKELYFKLDDLIYELLLLENENNNIDRNFDKYSLKDDIIDTVLNNNKRIECIYNEINNILNNEEFSNFLNEEYSTDNDIKENKINSIKNSSNCTHLELNTNINDIDSILAQIELNKIDNFIELIKDNKPLINKYSNKELLEVDFNMPQFLKEILPDNLKNIDGKINFKEFNEIKKYIENLTKTFNGSEFDDNFYKYLNIDSILNDDNAIYYFENLKDNIEDIPLDAIELIHIQNEKNKLRKKLFKKRELKSLDNYEQFVKEEIYKSLYSWYNKRYHKFLKLFNKLDGYIKEYGIYGISFDYIRGYGLSFIYNDVRKTLENLTETKNYLNDIENNFNKEFEELDNRYNDFSVELSNYINKFNYESDNIQLDTYNKLYNELNIDKPYDRIIDSILLLYINYIDGKLDIISNNISNRRKEIYQSYTKKLIKKG